MQLTREEALARIHQTLMESDYIDETLPKGTLDWAERQSCSLIEMHRDMQKLMRGMLSIFGELEEFLDPDFVSIFE